MVNELHTILNSYTKIGIDDLAAVSFLDRHDTKFVFHRKLLPELLHLLRNYYAVLEIDSKTVQKYETLYFDNNNRESYQQHQRGFRTRHKIRQRKYCNQEEYFFEIKSKSNKNKTQKRRFPIPGFMHPGEHPEMIRRIAGRTGFTASELEAVLQVNFNRITLAAYNPPQRITIDFDLSFFHFPDKEKMAMDTLCIAEIKKNRDDKAPDFFRTMKSLEIHPMGFSKYCMGLLEFEPWLKNSRFKPRLLQYKKLIS